MKTYLITGYGVNRRGLTVGIRLSTVSGDTRAATAQAMVQAQSNGLSHIRITRIMEVAHVA